MLKTYNARYLWNPIGGYLTMLHFNTYTLETTVCISIGIIQTLVHRLMVDEGTPESGYPLQPNVRH